MAAIRVGNVLGRLISRIDTCRDVTKLIAGEEKLALLERFRLWRHLAGCRGCSCYRRQIRLTVKTLAQLPIPEVSPSTKRFLLQEFHARRNG